MKTETTLSVSDPVFDPEARPTLFERLVGGLVRDRRDLPFVRLSLYLTLLMAPIVAVVFIPGLFRWWIAPAYLIPYFFYLGPVILMLHNTSHRPLYGSKLFNKHIPWGVGIWFGLSPETYYVHHLGMHHAEANLPDDLSSTMRYRRDSWIDFAKYYFRFLFGYPSIVAYFVRAGRARMLRRFAVGELFHFAVTAAALYVNWQAGLLVFVFPLLFTRFMLMSGNWAQHAFVDPDDPTNDYRTVTTFINSPYNHKCFNDGYHLGHHLKPSRHWLEMPEDFLAKREELIAQDSLVFEEIDYFVIFWLLMFKRHRSLARRVVQLDPANPRSEEELVALIDSRLQRFGTEQLAPLSKRTLAAA